MQETWEVITPKKHVEGSGPQAAKPNCVTPVACPSLRCSCWRREVSFPSELVLLREEVDVIPARFSSLSIHWLFVGGQMQLMAQGASRGGKNAAEVPCRALSQQRASSAQTGLIKQC